MSKTNKLLSRLLLKPKDFTYNEAKKLLNGFNYSEDSKGKTSGSRVIFVNHKKNSFIELHKPHRKEILKAYQIKQIFDELKIQRFIK